MSEIEPGTFSILVTGDSSHWSYTPTNVKEINYKIMKFSRIPMKDEFIRYKGCFYRVVGVYWNGKYGGEATLEVVSDGAD